MFTFEEVQAAIDHDNYHALRLMADETPDPEERADLLRYAHEAYDRQWGYDNWQDLCQTF